MQLEWRDEADADLFEILSYIAVRNFEAAFELKESIERSIEHLAEQIQ